ncbi:hypothetical protein Hanom_Chr10g00891151 [Helianthus anomalus]
MRFFKMTGVGWDLLWKKSLLSQMELADLQQLWNLLSFTKAECEGSGQLVVMEVDRWEGGLLHLERGREYTGVAGFIKTPRDLGEKKGDLYGGVVGR